MSYQSFRMVAFGMSNASLATVGYRLFNPDGTANGVRITAGVTERPAGSGNYGADVTIPDGFRGELRWDTGEATPQYASEQINPVDQISSLSVVGVNYPVLTNEGDLELIKGDTYEDDQGRAIDFQDDEDVWPVLTGATISFLIYNGSTLVSTIDMAVVTATGSPKKVRLELVAGDTSALEKFRYVYHVRATLADNDVWTLARGRLIFVQP